MRILLIVEAFRSIGGVQEIVDHLACELSRSGHTVALVSTPYVAPGSVRTGRAQVETAYLDIPSQKVVTWRHPERVVRQARGDELERYLVRWRPDVVSSHVWTWDKMPTVAAVCRRLRLPLVQSLYDSWGRGQLGVGALGALDYASALTAISRATRDYFAARRPAARNARVIGGGVDLEMAESVPAYCHERPYLFCASRIDLAHKALDVLVDAFAVVLAGHPGFDLLIAGDGPDRGRIEARVSAAGLAGKVVMLGGRRQHDELFPFYKGATLVVMPSRQPEGLGLVLLEAMSCGTPAVASRSGGAPEIVRDGQTGLLVEGTEPARWAAAILKLLGEPEALSAMGERGREYARRFGWGAVAAGFLDVYKSVAPGRLPGPSSASEG